MIVVARNYGQLGNRLFLYAHMIGAACEHGTSVANPCFAEYAHLFPSTHDDLWCRFPKVKTDASSPSLARRKRLSKVVYLGTRVLSTVGLRQYPYSIVRLRKLAECDLNGAEFVSLIEKGRPILAQGWMFRSQELLERHADTIRDHFQILPEHQQNVQQTIQRVRREADIVVGVHIRHGDYATFLDGKYFYAVKEYAEVMRRIAAELSHARVAFLVCSNADIAADDFAGLNVHYGPGHLVEDMYSFAQCDLLVGPPSTYTKWASFYGDVPLHVLETSSDHVAPNLLDSLQSISRRAA